MGIFKSLGRQGPLPRVRRQESLFWQWTAKPRKVSCVKIAFATRVFEDTQVAEAFPHTPHSVLFLHQMLTRFAALRCSPDWERRWISTTCCGAPYLKGDDCHRSLGWLL